MALPVTSKSILHALRNLSQTKSKYEREALLDAGLKELLKWFSLAAHTVLENKIRLPKQTQTFMTKHKKDMQKLASPLTDEKEKRRIILKPGGGGYLGGVMIRNLLRWDGTKTIRVSRKRKATPRQTPKKQDYTRGENEVYAAMEKHTKRMPNGDIYHIEKSSPLSREGKTALRHLYKTNGHEAKRVLEYFFGTRAVQKHHGQKCTQGKKRCTDRKR